MISWRTRRRATFQSPLLLVVKEAAQQIYERRERRDGFTRARAYADLVGKPLLVVGVPKALWNNHPCGDVTIDIESSVKGACSFQIADVRSIPYPDKYFGASFTSHVLEHLLTIEDAKKALRELHRVSDKVFVVSPHKDSLLAWMHPTHHLWISEEDGAFKIESRASKHRRRFRNYA